MLNLLALLFTAITFAPRDTQKQRLQKKLQYRQAAQENILKPSSTVSKSEEYEAFCAIWNEIDGEISGFHKCFGDSAVLIRQNYPHRQLVIFDYSDFERNRDKVEIFSEQVQKNLKVKEFTNHRIANKLLQPNIERIVKKVEAKELNQDRLEQVKLNLLRKLFKSMHQQQLLGFWQENTLLFETISDEMVLAVNDEITEFCYWKGPVIQKKKTTLPHGSGTWIWISTDKCKFIGNYMEMGHFHCSGLVTKKEETSRMLIQHREIFHYSDVKRWFLIWLCGCRKLVWWNNGWLSKKQRKQKLRNIFKAWKDVAKRRQANTVKFQNSPKYFFFRNKHTLCLDFYMMGCNTTHCKDLN